LQRQTKARGYEAESNKGGGKGGWNGVGEFRGGGEGGVVKPKRGFCLCLGVFVKGRQESNL
jgi:hypothetical protein